MKKDNRRFTESLGDGYTVFTDAENTFCEDSLLLAAFSPVRENALDLCSGCGIVALKLHQKGCRAVTAVEINAAACELIRQGARASHADITVAEADVRTFCEGKYDLITCNPPYFKEGRSPVARRNEIRSEVLLTADELFGAVARLLTPDGVFCFCQREERRTELTEKLHRHGLIPCRTQLVQTKKDFPPRLFCMEVRREKWEN